MSFDPDRIHEKDDIKGEAEHYELEQSSLGPELTELQKEIAIVAALSEEEYNLAEKKLVRKIDTRLLPTLFILLVLNYLDRNALASARVQGLEKDLGLVGTQFKRDRVELVARVIREALTPGNQPKMRKRLTTMIGSKSSASGRATPNSHGFSSSLAMNAGDEAFTLVALVMGNLLARPLPNEETFTEYVTQMIEATCHYILPPSPSSLGLYVDKTLAATAQPNLGTCCSLFPYCQCSPGIAPLSESLPRLSPLFDSETQQLVRQRYALARNGGLMSAFASFVHPDRVYLKSYLQDPQGVCLSGLEVSKKVRAVAWRILITNVHLFPVSGADSLSDTYPQGESITDMALVMEASASAGTSGKEEQPPNGLGETSEDGEDFVFEGKASQEDDDKSVAADPGIWITEYYRTGATQVLGPHDNLLFDGNETASSIPTSFPVTENKAQRQARFLTVLDTDLSKMTELEPKWQYLIALLRHAVRLQQASHSGNRKPWTAVEIERMAEAAVRSSAAWDHIDDVEETFDNKTPGPLLQNRNADIVAHVTAAALDVLALSQALLLGEGDPSEVIAIYRFMEGSMWHAALEAYSDNTTLSPLQRDIKSAVVAAVTEGFDSRYVLGLGTAPVSKQPKRERPESPIPAAPIAKKASGKLPKATHGRYDLLMEM
ncbi:hypothetical protein QFC19_008575 [Naganishia cerealis]|uniref:Uncharacterized protein n=1 Tax=Naganishia cerealis TaxID=610337 RepID=A0ACC2V1X9_9TREE|nr:hypothetical protein QFC19_008575 [Naganishia cerealis]